MVNPHTNPPETCRYCQQKGYNTNPGPNDPMPGNTPDEQLLWATKHMLGSDMSVQDVDDAIEKRREKLRADRWKTPKRSKRKRVLPAFPSIPYDPYW